MHTDHRAQNLAFFLVTLLLTLACLVASIVKTNAYNRTQHHAEFSGAALFSAEGMGSSGVTVTAVPRSSTWSKVFDLNHEGLTDFNYQAYTYDFTVMNSTRDEVDDFLMTLTFDRTVFLSSAWNGALEIHQMSEKGERCDLVPDMRVYDPTAHTLSTVRFDGEDLIPMHAGDYLVYYPSSTMNAMEVPISPYEATTPGLILYVAIGESIEDSTLALDYNFHRLITGEPLFWLSVTGMALWLVALAIFAITSAQIRKYRERHERDNKIINESIETFTGFIDAKDPYTNGHSKRVAIYTRLIAAELGYEGEELDRIYYIALLHDCGKIGVPDHILGKPGKLTDEEFEIIKSHTVRGGEILSSFKSLEGVELGARYHHERYDGRGYPEGLAGEDIPFIARMICVADSFDAMNSNRVYRNKLTRETIIGEIETNKGRQFDPKVADVMLALLRDGRIAVGE
ncbi:MAG: HD-GYP domain-containing protein [Oscillospiraceae bacterium]|nr:HD-GYP domain-containing protein [Oscillospiraceae bacterium]